MQNGLKEGVRPKIPVHDKAGNSPETRLDNGRCVLWLRILL